MLKFNKGTDDYLYDHNGGWNHNWIFYHRNNCCSVYYQKNNSENFDHNAYDDNNYDTYNYNNNYNHFVYRYEVRRTRGWTNCYL